MLADIEVNFLFNVEIVCSSIQPIGSLTKFLAASA